MKRSNLSQSIHDRMILSIVSLARNKDHIRIAADHIKHQPRPHLINGHKPDVTSIRYGQEHIFEVETADSIHHSHTESQWKAFDRASAHFTVVVPSGFRHEAYRRANAIGVNPEEIVEL